MRRVLYGRHRAGTAPPAGGSAAGIAATPRDAPERPTSPAQTSARPGVEFWRSGRIVPPRTRRPRRGNRGIARKPPGAFDGAARTILPERHFCAPPPEDQPGPSRPVLPEALEGAAARPTGRPPPGSVQTPIVAGSEFLFHDSPGAPPPAGPGAGGDRRAHGAVRSVGRPRLRRDHPRPGPLRAGEHYRRCAGHCGSGRAQRRSSGRRPSSPDRVPRRIRLDRCRRRGCGRSNPPRARPRRARPGLLADRRRGRGRVRSDDCPRVRLSRR